MKETLKDIVVLGSGGFAKEVAFLIKEINRFGQAYNFLGYVDDEIGKKIGEDLIVYNDDWLIETSTPVCVVIGIGNPEAKKRIFEKLSKNKNIFFPTLIHPNVTGDWKQITFGQGNVICASCCFTTNITIGNFNAFNLCSTVGHDVIIGNYNVINPTTNISGGVELKSQILVGTKTAILENLKITSRTIIGAGSTVIKDIKESGTYIGTPARKIK